MLEVQTRRTASPFSRHQVEEEHSGEVEAAAANDQAAWPDLAAASPLAHQAAAFPWAVVTQLEVVVVEVEEASAH